MKVGEYLRVPYVVTAWSEELPDGRWVRHVENPELPGCSAEAASIEEALSRLEELRPRLILEMLTDGRRPLMRKSLMGVSQTRVRLGNAGLLGVFDPVWDVDVENISGRDVSEFARQYNMMADRTEGETMPITGLYGFGLEANDLSVAVDYYSTFGLEAATRNSDAIFRCQGRDQDQIVVREGPHKKLAWVGFTVEPGALGELTDRLVADDNTQIDGPDDIADGHWFTDPDGMPVLLTEFVPARPRPYPALVWNMDGIGSRIDQARWRELTETPKPRRLGHVVKYSPDLARAEEFYTRALGLRLSDRMAGRISFWNTGSGDHHVFGLSANKGSGLHHASFEVANIDEISLGARHMKEQGHFRQWGLGRHTYGSNFFTYIQDPWGSWTEYFSDMDQITEGWIGCTWDPSTGAAVWGPPMPEGFHANNEVRAGEEAAHV